MKILIISLPRTGSNSLMKIYSEKFNLKMIGEPFNPNNLSNSFEIEENIVVKTIVNQKPKNITNCKQFYIDFSKNFNEVILLSRKDKKACCESLAFLNYNEKNGFKYDEKYQWYETPNIEESKKFINESEQFLLDLSESLKIPIIYYEDIFDLSSPQKLRFGNLKTNKII